MPTLKAYAIRHKPSGLMLPARRERPGRGSVPIRAGFTHFEPAKGLPRLFTREDHAKRALGCWLKGEWSEVTVGGSSMYGDDFDYYPEPPKEAPEHRKAEDMEIVPIKLTWSL